MPKDKPRRRPAISRVKKYEIEKQTLLIMEQMIDHVKDFTTKERYFDYKKISQNIKAFKITPADCKKMWEQFKSKLRGQFKEGNDEMKQCRDECNEDFWTHHYRGYSARLKVYSKMVSHPEIIDDLCKLNELGSDENQFNGQNELLDLNKNQDKLLPVVHDFENAIRTCDDHDELDALDNVIQNLGNEFEQTELAEKDLSK